MKENTMRKTPVIVMREKPLTEKERLLLMEMFPGKVLDIIYARIPSSPEEWRDLCASHGIPEDVKVIYPDPYPLYLTALREGYEHFSLHHVVGWKLMRPPQFARMTEDKKFRAP